MTRSLRQDKRQHQKRKQQEPRGEKSVCHCTVLPVPTSKAVYYWSRRRFGDGQTDTKEISREKASETRKRQYLLIFFSSWNFPPSFKLQAFCPLLPLFTATDTDTGTGSVPALVCWMQILAEPVRGLRGVPGRRKW